MPTFQYSGRRKGGHAPGHIREAFCDAGDAFVEWVDSGRSGPEPTVTVEIHYEPHEMTLSRACGLLWNCSDQLPGHFAELIAEACEVEAVSTYAHAARAMRAVLTR
jgi:hypothetical protein